MNVEKLKGQRQHNVQQQNALSKHKIYTEARYWREKGLPEALVKTFRQFEINPARCIVLDYEQDFPGCCSDEGIVLTEQGEFFQFEIDLNAERSNVLSLELWDNITEEIEVKKQIRSTGASWGFLALEVLKELNGTPPEDCSNQKEA